MWWNKPRYKGIANESHKSLFTSNNSGCSIRCNGGGDNSSSSNSSSNQRFRGSQLEIPEERSFLGQK